MPHKHIFMLSGTCLFALLRIARTQGCYVHRHICTLADHAFWNISFGPVLHAHRGVVYALQEGEALSASL